MSPVPPQVAREQGNEKARVCPGKCVLSKEFQGEGKAEEFDADTEVQAIHS